MAKPIIRKITPFDANKDYEITISWLGNRAYANRIYVYDNETNALVFDDTVSTFDMKHTIPSHTLTNGRKYYIQAQTYDEESIESPLSDKVLFYCLTTPEFRFENIPDSGIITNASFTASVYYYSPDWEDINKYVFYLYDSTQRPLFTSEDIIDSNEYSVDYTYKGLNNDTVYYIRCTGVTVNGMELDTGFVEISVKYENPNTYARIYATPIPSQGCIQVSTNLIIIQYNGTDSFDYFDGMIDLRDKTLYYDDGFLINGDFTVIIRGIYLWQTNEIFKMANSDYGLTLSSRIYQDGQLRFRLMVPNGVGHYLIYSEPQVFENEDMVTVAIRRKNDVYQLKVFIELNFATEGNMWYGTRRPEQKLTEDYDEWIDIDGDTYRVDKDDCITYMEEIEPNNPNIDNLWIGGE